MVKQWFGRWALGEYNMADESIHLEDMIKIKKFDGPGRGRKQCPKCNAYMGIRTKTCSCEHTFSKDDKPVVKLTDEQLDLMKYLEILGKTSMDTVVYTPTEFPNIKLLGLSKNDVFDWADNVIDFGKENFKIYTPHALRYMIGHQVGYNSEEYYQCRDWLDEWKDTLI